MTTSSVWVRVRRYSDVSESIEDLTGVREIRLLYKTHTEVYGVNDALQGILIIIPTEPNDSASYTKNET